MKQKDIFVLVGIGILAAIISAAVAGSVFTSAKNRSTKVPIVTPISTTFPDIHNDPTYQGIFNANAIDPTQLIKVGANQNQQPFSNTNQ